MKVLGAKVEDEIYRKTVEKAAKEELTPSEVLRKLIMAYLKEELKINKATESIFILRESLKVLNQMSQMLRESTLIGADKVKIIEFLERQIKEFESKLRSLEAIK